MRDRHVVSISTLAFTFGWLASAAAHEESKKEPDLPLEGKTESLAFSTDEGSWLSLDVSPDGETIIFDLLGDLYTLPMTGGEATRITSGLGFDSQPVVSPDGRWIAFISDRSGSNNLWIARPDGSGARKLSDDEQWGSVSPAWMPDSKTIVVTRRAVKNEFTMFHIDGGSGVKLNGVEEDDEVWGSGPEISPDGKYLYFAQGVDNYYSPADFPVTQISRYEFTSGAVDQVTQGEGGAVRPALSPDGRFLVYGTRDEAQTGFRIRSLQSGADRWLTYPVQRDAQENYRRDAQENYRPPSRDLLPSYSFTPDGKSIVFNAEGKIWRVEISSGDKTEIPFTADIDLDIGPNLTVPYRVPQDPLTATLIHDPMLSPDGESLIASVLTKLYVTDAEDGAEPRRLTSGDAWEFKPVWSPDGRWIAYVTWSMNDGGQIRRMRSNGRGNPQQLTDIPDFYTDLVYSPDGETLYAMRGNEYMRHQTFSEFFGLGIPLDLVSLPSDGGNQDVIAAARGARNPHFGSDPNRIYMFDENGLFSLQVDGSDRREELSVTGPRGNQLDEDPPKAEMIKISPDGAHVLAFVAKQIWAIPIVRSGGKAPAIDIRNPSLAVAQLTDIGADFFGWTADGTSVYWAIGHTFYRRPFDGIEFTNEVKKENDDDDENADSDDPFVPKDEHKSVVSFRFEIVVPRDSPSGSILLRGANVITMAGATTEEMNNVLENQDILVTDNRIAAIGSSGSLAEMQGTEIIDVGGKYIVPGFVDTHAHFEVRTGDVLEPQNWSLIANLAYGVTAGLDVQTERKDFLAYRDFIETGQSLGQRAFMTARGIFGDTDFKSYGATLSYLRRYKEHYKTPNIKSYKVGNRKQRQWVVLASKELGLMPTTEGAADQKLNITHAIDGMHGNEHNLPDSPIFRDVVELYARTKTAYTPTLLVQYNAERMREYFFTRMEFHDDPKLRRFYPRNRLDELTRRRPGWQRDEEFQFRQAAAQAAKIQRAGGLVGVGGHAELQGLGYHWEMWAYEMGGMTPAEVLRAATIDGARIIGIDQDLGSIEAGKLADILILNSNPLENIRNTEDIDQVVQNGRLYDGDTLDQIWPDQTPLAPFWWWSETDPRFNADASTP